MRNRYIISAAYFAPSVLLCILYGVGYFGKSVDFWNYFDLYRVVSNPSYQDTFRYEMGFIYTLQFIKAVTDLDILVITAIMAFISLNVKIYYLSFFESKILPTYYIMCLFFVHEFTQIRMALALTFVFLALECHRIGRRKLAYAISALGILFQYLTVLFVAAIALDDLRYKLGFPFRSFALVTCLLVGAVVNLALQYAIFLNPLIEVYQESQFSMNILSVRFIYIYFILLFGYISLRSLDRHAELILLILSLFTSASIAVYQIPVVSIRILEASFFAALIFPFMVNTPFWKKFRLLVLPLSVYTFYQEFIALDRISFGA